MTTIFVSPNERRAIKKLIGDDGVEMVMPHDFKLYTRAGIVAGERKRFPSDFLASITDGRMSKECAAMRYAPFRVLFAEGRGTYNEWGMLMNGRMATRWTRGGIRNLLRSLRYVEGVDVEFTRNMAETVQCLHELQVYFDATNHVSMRRRAGFSPDFMYKTEHERYLHWLQGLPEIGYRRAVALAEVYHCPVDLFAATASDLRAVRGMTDPASRAVCSFLHDTRPVTEKVLTKSNRETTVEI